MVAMGTSSITIRLPEDQRATLKATAKRLKKSESDVIRELLSREFEQTAFGERAGDFFGCVESTPDEAAEPDPFRTAIQRNNRRVK